MAKRDPLRFSLTLFAKFRLNQLNVESKAKKKRSTVNLSTPLQIAMSFYYGEA